MPETAQGLDPGILDPPRFKQLAKRIPVEVRKLARTGKSPDVCNAPDLEFLQEVQKILKRPVRMSNRKNASLL